MEKDKDKIFIKCRTCNVLKGCRTNDDILPCRVCTEEQFIKCTKVAESLNMQEINIRTHLCVLCQEKNDILLPIRNNTRDDFSIPGSSIRFN